MKIIKYYILILSATYFSLLFTANIYSQEWKPLHKAVLGDDILKIFIVEKDVFLAFKESCEVARSEDGGKTWSTVFSAKMGSYQPNKLLSPFYTRPETGGFIIAADFHNSVLFSKDKGYSFKYLKRESVWDTISYASFSDSSSGIFAISNRSYITHTTNGGKNWSLRTIPDISNSQNIKLIDNRNVLFRTGENRFYKYDFADSILTEMNPPEIEIVDFFFFNDSTGYGVTGNNKLIFTGDGGKEWQEAGLSFEEYNAMYWLNEKTGWIAADKKIFHTTDGGTNWEVLPYPLSFNLCNMDFLDDNYGIICSNIEMAVTNDGGSTWNKIIENNKYYNNNFSDIIFLPTSNNNTESRTGFIVGGEIILKTMDSGNTWKKCFEDSLNNFVAIDFYDEKLGAIGASTGIIPITDDGGVTWNILNKYGDYDFNKINDIGFLDENTLWISVYRRNYSYLIDISEEEDFESIKKVTTLILPETPNHLSFRNDGLGWFIGQRLGAPGGGFWLFITTDYGKSWIHYHFIPTLGSLDRQYGRKLICVGNKIFMIGFLYASFGTVIEPRIYFYVGDQYIKHIHLSEGYGIVEAYEDISFIDENNGWLAGSHIWKTTDGGYNWNKEFSNRYHINSLYMINENLGFAVGNNGAIYKYEVPATRVKNTERKIADDFELYQNYPNPFNGETVISYKLKTHSNVTLTIYNTLGQEIITLVNEDKAPGNYKTAWNGKNKSGIDVTSGIYIYKFNSSGFVKSKKMVLLQ